MPAYNDQKKKNYDTRRDNTQRHNNFNKRPMNEIVTFPLNTNFFFIDRRNNSEVEIDRNVVLSTLMELNDNKVFEKLTQNVGVSNAVLYNDPNKKGSSTIGFINSIDTINETVTITIFGSSVDKVKSINKDMVINPKIIVRNGNFRCFNGFELEIV